MASPKRKFGDLGKAARERAARAGREYGLTRRQTRERYNRGTFNPLSSDPGKRVPLEYRHFTGPGGTGVDWQEAALDNLRAKFGDYFKVNDDTLVFNAYHMSDDIARLVATAGEDELSAWASIQPDADGNAPDIETLRDAGLPDWVTLDDIGTYDDDGNWYNIFWYH